MEQNGGVERVGRYEITSELGRGGMGVVYRGVDTAIGREVAIKMLTEGLANDPNMLARFYDEVRITGKLNHPNIVTVYQVGEHNGAPYIVMEFLPGKPLDKLTASEEAPTLIERLRIIEEVCRALGFAHQKGVIHRDVKPANIFVLPDGNAKLLDFGIARLERQEHGHTRVGFLIGTVPYMAPERLRGRTLDGRSDIFSTGVVLYELIAGQPPFSGDETVVMQKILSAPYPSLSDLGIKCPLGLEAIVDHALAKRPDDRYAAAEEMAADLAAVIAEMQPGQVREMLAEAQGLVGQDQLANAHSVLARLLQIDPRNAQAKELLARVQDVLTQRRREYDVQQIRQVAEDAFNAQRYDQCLSILENNPELVAGSPELMALRENAQREKERQSKINTLMAQAEVARRKGDFKSAIAAAERARKIDKTNSRIIAICNGLKKEMQRAQGQAQARTLLNSARNEMDARRYAEAMQILKQVEEVDPTNPDLPLLLGDVRNRMEQTRRREVVTRLEEEVAQASSFEQLQQAAASIQQAIAEMPMESGLIRLSAEVQRLVLEQENKRLVDETLLACKNLGPREALERVRKAQAQLPGNETLMEHEARLVERVKAQTVEERRADYLAGAREALGKQDYASAVSILEFCQAEGIASAEIMQLLELARHEEAEHQRLEQLSANLSRARALIDDSAFDEAVAFLEETLRQEEDPALRRMLGDAFSGREALLRQIKDALGAAIKFLRAGKRNEATQLLRMQPRPVQQSESVQSALVVLEDEQQQVVYRTLGRAYAALETNIPAGELLLRQAARATADPALCRSMGELFRAHEQAFADRAISGAIQRSKALLKERDKIEAEKQLLAVFDTLPYASPKLQAEWESARRKSTASGLIARLRG
jgi:serine/threonine-protein kinase